MLKIVDRRSMANVMRNAIEAKVNAEPKPAANPTEMYSQMAESIRRKRASISALVPPSKHAKRNAPQVVTISEPDESLSEIADRIRDGRIRESAITPIPVLRSSENGFKFRDRHGNLIKAEPTFHAIQQFVRRIALIKPHLRFGRHEDVLRSMIDHFNKCQRVTDEYMEDRKSKYKLPMTPIMIGTKSYGFVVSPNGSIITFELRGKFGALNRVHHVEKAYD